MESPKPPPDCGKGGVVAEVGAGLTESALARCGGGSLSFEVGASSGEVEGSSLGDGSDVPGVGSSCSVASMGDDEVSETAVL
jgi:hypothetical protein